jgi:hypothetical protein
LSGNSTRASGFEGLDPAESRGTSMGDKNALLIHG